MVDEKDVEKVSRVVSHALRHEPWLYELELDEQGWVTVDDLIKVLHRENSKWSDITTDTLVDMITASDKKRHEICDGKIRALYGHSVPKKLLKQPAIPPIALYHGTSPELARIILKDGLLPMGRQYVHLSIDIDTAIQVGRRKSNKPVLLQIETDGAMKNGTVFYRGNYIVWLANHISSEFIASHVQE
ncbi:RNA 2'-phosphotransferase [Aeromonas veronii]|uniref:RNA 2'-phosphotransferase n=1 Tax=Aeromonas veronii TaxID=654 RepID=UPI000F5EBE5A|nr:RNA 2'-phosphotransferase [Aeromonas veronii]MBA2081460.1 RNA 2'-phosphotransferase [Aeromonas veronii]MCX0424725.1 RNA 2'-phosphotransferase [Aeromonas veronii]RRA91658.1 RNA 2'-phosphotransferase [Aeromonas veronii bv. sobria]TNI69650.1 RNA 2'-phosphotransferase [Aeromonas veronii]WIJ41007.1 RNA 2'-phosphotransferase [Aeromonas veronii]